MKNRIHHILRSVTITCLMAGFLAHLIVPFSSQAQKTAFTRWLNHNVVASGNESEIKLRNSINELPEQTGDFWRLVQEASELVANHKDHFKILVSNSGESQNPPKSNWLIDQWNSFQNQKSGFNSILTESAKALANWIPQSPNFLFFKTGFETDYHGIYKKQFPCLFGTSADFLQPLSSGISINAP